MAHVAKYTRGATGHLCRHFERGTDAQGEPIKYGNQDIDLERSHMNYNLAPAYENQIEFIRQRCSEVQCSKRADVNVMCSWVITAPKDLPSEEQNTFFRESYAFLTNRYDEKNVVSSYVHMDEITPHMHFAFVPVVHDQKKDVDKVSAKELLTKKDLQSFHRQLDERMKQVFGRDIGVLNEVTRDGNRSILELKQGTAITEAAKLDLECAQRQKEVEALENKAKALTAQIRGLESQIGAITMSWDEVDAIKPQKALGGAVRGVSVEDVERLKDATKKYYSLLIDNERLTQEKAILNKQVPSLKQKMLLNDEIYRLRQIERAFQLLTRDVQQQLLQNLGRSPSKGQER